MNSKAEFFRLAGSTVVIEYKNKSIITAIRIIEFGEKTTKFILLNSTARLRKCFQARMRHILQNRVRENEVLYQTALSIAYSGVFHNYINALTLLFLLH